MGVPSDDRQHAHQHTAENGVEQAARLARRRRRLGEQDRRKRGKALRQAARDRMKASQIRPKSAAADRQDDKDAIGDAAAEIERRWT